MAYMMIFKRWSTNANMNEIIEWVISNVIQSIGDGGVFNSFLQLAVRGGEKSCIRVDTADGRA